MQNMLDTCELKFYRAFNALYCRSHCSNSELVSTELVKAYCLPVLLLLYALESTAPSKQVIHMMDRCIDVAVRKIFRVSTSESCAYIRSCVGLHCVAELVQSRTVTFMNSLAEHQFPAEVVELAFSELFAFIE